jgi:hypothetical protein
MRIRQLEVSNSDLKWTNVGQLVIMYNAYSKCALCFRHNLNMLLCQVIFTSLLSRKNVKKYPYHVDYLGIVQRLSLSIPTLSLIFLAQDDVVPVIHTHKYMKVELIKISWK